VQFWDDFLGGGAARVIPRHGVSHLTFTPDGRRMLLVAGRPAVLTLGSGAVEEVPLGWPDCAGNRCTLSPDGRQVLLGQTYYWRPQPQPSSLLSCRRLDDLARTVWSVESHDRVQSPPLFLPGGDSFLTLVWRTEGRTRSDCEYLFVVRDVQTGAVRSEVRCPADVAFDEPVQSADARLIASRGNARFTVLRVEDLGADPVLVRNDSRRQFTGLAFHPSGRYLAATSNDATVKLYDTSSWQMAHAFDWGVGRLRSVAFSPDGTLAAAGGDNGKVVVWDFDL